MCEGNYCALVAPESFVRATAARQLASAYLMIQCSQRLHKCARGRTRDFCTETFCRIEKEKEKSEFLRRARESINWNVTEGSRINQYPLIKAGYILKQNSRNLFLVIQGIIFPRHIIYEHNRILQIKLELFASIFQFNLLPGISPSFFHK